MGSIPITRSIVCICFVGSVSWVDEVVTRVLAHIAQAVEHFLGKEEVTGSIPVMSSSLLLLIIFRGLEALSLFLNIVC